MPTSTTASIYGVVKIEQIRRVFSKPYGKGTDFETIETAYYDAEGGKLVVTVYLTKGVNPEVIQHPLAVIEAAPKETP